MIAFDRKFGEQVSIHGVANSSCGLTWLDPELLRCCVMENEEVVEAVAEDAVVEEELLIEEISIDGMCGVY
jgi:mycofactocin precursor